MTLCIEAVGLAILCVWIVIPINEFKEILGKVRPQEDPHERGLHEGDHREGHHGE